MSKCFRHLGTFLLHFRCSLPVFLTPFLGETLFFSKNYFSGPSSKSLEVSTRDSEVGHSIAALASREKMPLFAV
jgi:hypothetical protein